VEIALTADEQRAIATLKRLSKRWLSNGHTLYVMRTGSRSECVVTSEGGFDPNYIVGCIDIPSDGGDF